VRDLELANKRLAVAIASLSKAERRYFDLPDWRRSGPEPDWYAAAQQAEADAAAIVDKLHLQIARTRAHGREGLAVKVRLLAAAYGEDLNNDVRDDEDLVSCLVRSLIADLS
jgi:hypothetical protein